MLSMTQKQPVFIHATNPYYLLVKIYSERQVRPDKVVDGVRIGPRSKAHHVDLSGSYLQGAFLAFSDFSESDLSHVNLQAGSISFGDFRDVSLKDSLVSITSFAEAEMKGADLRGAQMILMDNSGVDLRHADLRCVELVGSTFDFAKLQKADFRGSVLRDIGFQYSDLRGTNFENNVLTGCTFYGAKISEDTFEGAIFDNTIMPDGTLLSTTELPSKTIRFGSRDSGLMIEPDSAVYAAALQEQTPGQFQYGTKLEELDLVAGTNAYQLDLTGWNLSDLSLDGSDFRAADLTGSDLGGTSFVASQLDDLIAVGAQLVNGSIAHSCARRADFDNTIGPLPAWPMPILLRRAFAMLIFDSQTCWQRT